MNDKPMSEEMYKEEIMREVSERVFIDKLKEFLSELDKFRAAQKA